MEGIAKLQFRSKLALLTPDSDSPQVAYDQQDMSTCGEREPAPKSSGFASKASFAIPSIDYFYSFYTERDSKIGFGLTRKLPRFDDRKLPNIRNMRQLAIAEPRGFGAAEISIFESRSV